MLIDIQDDIAPIFTESIHNETTSNKAKYEIIVVLHKYLVFMGISCIYATSLKYY